jgi:hypothetical protein
MRPFCLFTKAHHGHAPGDGAAEAFTTDDRHETTRHGSEDRSDDRNDFIRAAKRRLHTLC